MKRDCDISLFFYLNIKAQMEKNVNNKILEIEHRIEKGGKRTVTVLGKTFTVTDTKRNILNKIYDIQFKIKFFEGEENLKNMRKRMKYINSSDARMASLLLLNGWANIPLLHAIHWRWMSAKYTTETFSAIIEKGLNDEDNDFFFKSCRRGIQLLAARTVMLEA